MPTVREIVEKTAQYYDFTPGQLLSSKRSQPLAFVRQMAMKLCRDLTDMSLPAIGARFGDRDHTTVLHGCRLIEEKLLSGSKVRADYEAIKTSLFQEPTPATTPPERKPETPTLKIYRKGFYSKWKRC